MAALWLHDAQIQKHVSSVKSADGCPPVFTVSLKTDGGVCNWRDVCG